MRAGRAVPGRAATRLLAGLLGYFADPRPEASAFARALAAVDWPAVQNWLDPIRALVSTLVPESHVRVPPVYGYVGVMLGLALFRFPIPHGSIADAVAGSTPYARMFGGISVCTSPNTGPEYT